MGTDTQPIDIATITSNHSPVDEATKKRLSELMFHVVPDPDEDATDEVMDESGKVDYDESLVLIAEFRSIIESLDGHPDVRHIVLHALDDIEASTIDEPLNLVEWMNTTEVLGRRIKRALGPLLD